MARSRLGPTLPEGICRTCGRTIWRISLPGGGGIAWRDAVHARGRRYLFCFDDDSSQFHEPVTDVPDLGDLAAIETWLES